MTKYYVYPYRYECDNAIMLKNRLKGQRIKLVDSNYKQKPGDVIINWGNSKCPYSGPAVINEPFAVYKAVNKSITFDLLRNHHINTPKLTRDKKIALEWIEQGASVVGRKQLKGNNGDGIFFLEEHPDEEAKLYTMYMHDMEEYRVNVYRGKLISIRAKKQTKGLPENKIKSGINGYTFVPVNLPEPLIRGFINTVDVSLMILGLDFGGVDLLYQENFGSCVLEINTAPELQGAAMDTLANYIKQDYS